MNDGVKHPPVYNRSSEFAHLHGESGAYHASDRLNIVCAGAIGTAVSGHDAGNDFAASISHVNTEYGMGRVAWVLANALREKQNDGRISYSNREWAMAFPIPIEYSLPVSINIPHTVLDGLAGEIRKELLCVYEQSVDGQSTRRPSVMDQLRKAKKAPPAPRKQKDGHGKDGLEL